MKTAFTIDNSLPFAITEKAFKQKQQDALDNAASEIERSIRGRDLKGLPQPRINTVIMADRIEMSKHYEGAAPNMDMSIEKVSGMLAGVVLSGECPEGQSLPVKVHNTVMSTKATKPGGHDRMG